MPAEPRGAARGFAAAANLHPRAVLAVVWLLSAVYTWSFHDRGWIPHDEGCIAQSADRILAGQLPHRDFDEIYTGGLSYWHAAAMEAFGRNLVSLRFALFGAFLAFVPIVYFVARRLAPPLVSGAVTLTAVVWSFPNYFAGLPSWYNLIFTLLGILFVMRHVETGRRSFLLAAGMCGGISFLFKLVGLYYLFGVAFFLLYREELLAREAPGPRKRPWLLLVLKAALALGTPVALLVLLRDRLAPMELVHFVLPAAVVALFLFREEARHPKAPGAARLRGLARLLVPLAVGAAIPVAACLAPYLPGGSVPDFLRGVFVLPQRRLASASLRLPPIASLLPAIPYALLLAALPLRLGRTAGRLLTALLVAALAALLVVSGQIDAYQFIWLSARSLGPVAVLIGCLRLAREDATATNEQRQKLFLLLCVTACVGLQQFPYAGPIYFCYVAPVVILALLAVESAPPARGGGVPAVVLAFYFLFAVVRLNPSYVSNLGRVFRPYVADARLDGPRGGLRVPRADRDLYGELLEIVRRESRGRTIYAGPDAPEVYFLAGLPNPTRAILEFNSESPTRGLPLPAFLEDNGIQAIVINRLPAFSAPLEPRLDRALESAWPRSRELGKFLVRWRDAR